MTFEKIEEGFFVLNNDGFKKLEEKKLIEIERASMAFELALKEAKIKELEEQNSLIMLDLALMKGGNNNNVV